MLAFCGKNELDYKELQFGETLESEWVSDLCTLNLEVYYDENNKEVYNISVERSGEILGLVSHTTDYFETRDLEEAQNFYKSILNMFKHVNENTDTD